MVEDVPSAFQNVNEAYEKGMEAYTYQPLPSSKVQEYAQIAAHNTGVESLENYTQELADNNLRPLIESNNINPVQASTAKEQIGLDEPNADQIIKNRYSEYGRFQIGKLEQKFGTLKHLYEDVMFEPEYRQKSVNDQLQKNLESGILTPDEVSQFSEIRKNLLEKKENAQVESIFLSINDNPHRVDYLKRELHSERINSELVKNLVTEYGLSLSESDKKELGLSAQQ